MVLICLHSLLCFLYKSKGYRRAWTYSLNLAEVASLLDIACMFAKLVFHHQVSRRWHSVWLSISEMFIRQPVFPVTHTIALMNASVIPASEVVLFLASGCFVFQRHLVELAKVARLSSLPGWTLIRLPVPHNCQKHKTLVKSYAFQWYHVGH